MYPEEQQDIEGLSYHSSRMKEVPRKKSKPERGKHEEYASQNSRV